MSSRREPRTDARTRGMSANGAGHVRRDDDGDLESICCADGVTLHPGDEPWVACNGCGATLAEGEGAAIDLLHT